MLFIAVKLQYHMLYIHKRKNLLEKNKRIGLQKEKWQKQGYRIDNAYHYYFWDQSYSTLCIWMKVVRYSVGLISEEIVISIVNPIPLFLSLYFAILSSCWSHCIYAWARAKHFGCPSVILSVCALKFHFEAETTTLRILQSTLLEKN